MRTSATVLICLSCTCLGRRAQHAANPEQHLKSLAMLLVESNRADAFNPSSQGGHGWVGGKRHGTPLASASSRREVVAGATAAAAAAALPFAADAAEYPKLRMTTTEGVMEFDLWNDVAPKHVKSFLELSKKGFFDGGAFHRIIPGFVIQGGDPNAKVGYGADGTLASGDKSAQRKWGTGGPGYNVPAEFNERLHEFGVLSMARAQDPNSAGSQFFVCLGRLPSLDNQYTVFGKLTKGEDVLKKIAAAKTDPGDRPQIRQGIEKVEGI